MAFDITLTIEALRDSIVDNGRAEQCVIGHQFGLPTEQLSASVFMDSFRVAETTLVQAIELHIATVRVYQLALGQELELVEINVVKAAGLIMDDFFADFDVANTVRQIDIGGIYGVVPAASFDFIEDGRYFAAELTVPMIVDPGVTLTA